MKFRKKPEHIDAIQWTGKNLADVKAFVPPDSLQPMAHKQMALNGLIAILLTSGLTIFAKEGDWIVRGRGDILHVLKPEQFEAAYEAVTA